MESMPHYKQPPITEAILDLRVTLPETITLDSFAAIRDQVREDYPNVEQVVTGTLSIQPALGRVTTAEEHTGITFRSADGKRVFQATRAGFTFNRLRPYDKWEAFSQEAKRLWEIYKDACKPILVTRAALRYINRLELPSTLQDFQTYLRTVPEISPEIPPGVTGFFMQVQMQLEDPQCALIMNETLAPQTDPETFPVILDFDLFRVQNWASDDDDIWRFLEQLRVRKNLVFEASITDAARKLFN